MPYFSLDSRLAPKNTYFMDIPLPSECPLDTWSRSHLMGLFMTLIQSDNQMALFVHQSWTHCQDLAWLLTVVQDLTVCICG